MWCLLVKSFAIGDPFLISSRFNPPFSSHPLSTSDNEYYVNKDEGRANGGHLKLFVHPRLILPEFPAVTAPPETLVRIRHGGAANLPEFSKAPLVRVFEGQTRLVCLARRVAGTLFQPKVVLI
jgi:hypothetical protein